MVKRLIEKELVDYIAMDIKAPLTGEYSKAIGVNAEKFLGKVKEMVETLLRFGMDNEFRTTVVSTVHKKKKDIEEICRDIKGCKKGVLQKFDASLGKETLDPDC